KQDERALEWLEMMQELQDFHGRQLQRQKIDFEDKDHKRQAGIAAANDRKRRKAKGDYELYRKIAEPFASKNPKLTRNRLAQLVRDQLKRQGRRAPTTKTISKALKK